MQIVHTQRQTHTSPENLPLPRCCSLSLPLSLRLSAPPGCQITFQDRLGYTFGPPVRGWHTYRKAGPVSSPSPWLTLKEVLNIPTPLSLRPVGHTAPQGYSAAAGDLFSCSAASSDHYYYYYYNYDSPVNR